MNLKMPTTNEIKIAYQHGESSVVALFNEVGLQLVVLAEALEKQTAAIKELQAMLAKDSSNSGKPPSSDGYHKKKAEKRTESQRKKGQNTTGGQKGHPGETLKSTAHPDKIEIHLVECCEYCGHCLKNEAVMGYEERQVFDIPSIHIEITAHHAEIKICPTCSLKNKGEFPLDTTEGAQYGKGVKAWASYFSVQHFIPLARVSQIFEDLIDRRVSEASVLKFCHQLAEKVAPATAAIKTQLQQADVVHFDESGLRVKGKLHWLHSASTERLTHYTVHQKRGQIAMDEAGILPHFIGTACHDHWKPYFNYEGSKHALCNAHHLRELTFIEKQYQQPFAPKMAGLLLEINQAKKANEIDSFTDAKKASYQKRYDHIVKQGFEANPEKPPDPKKKPKRGRTKQTPAHNLLKRLRDFSTEVLAFMHDFCVPFTNNLAEQDVRMIKVKQKVSGCFRTKVGAEVFVKNRGYISTARKNNENIFQAIHSAFDNKPFQVTSL
ncbi:MAG: IS66 family transposase [Gammaproteobacteria bacterium]|nr:IS66 family transposase [Gammaproteobacteria bacterium]